MAALLGVLATLPITTFRHGERHGKLDEQIGNIEKNLKDAKPAMVALDAIVTLSKNPGLAKLAEQIGPPQDRRNPYDPARKVDLINRYQVGQITLPEAEELQTILQEDITMARGADAAAVVAVVLILIGVVVLIAILSARAAPRL